MRATYAVTWRHGEAEPRSGSLELTPGGIAFEGANGDGPTRELVPYRDLRRVRVGRTNADRISGRQTLVIEHRTGELIRVAGVVQAGIISELAEHLSSLLGEERVMSRAVVVLPLREGASKEAAELLRGGPPFDPQEAGLERHHVFLTDEEAVFVFESYSPDAAEKLIGEGRFWSAASAWNDLVEGPPRLAEDAYSWARPHVPDDLSFGPMPGPGDSDGGDLF
jgi:hypothetical protein